LPFYEAGPLADRSRVHLYEQRMLAVFMSAVAALAILLAGIGLYGLVACSVAERAAEIGIRMAMGARLSDVVGGVLGQAVRLVALGILAGAPIAWAGTKVLEGRLFGTGSLDPVVWVSATVTFVLLAIAAAAGPARAAARI